MHVNNLALQHFQTEIRQQIRFATYRNCVSWINLILNYLLSRSIKSKSRITTVRVIRDPSEKDPTEVISNFA